MKRVLFALSMLAASLIGITSCEQVEVPGEITIPDAESKAFFQNGISFSATQAEDALTARVTFTASTDWSVAVDEATATKSAPWLSVSPSSGEAGTATITVSAQENTIEQERSAKVTITCGDASKSFTVTQAGKKPAATVKLDKEELTLAPGQTEQLVATIEPADAANKTVTWSSSNEDVATVEDGLVTAIKEGEAIIRAKAGNIEAECKVTIVAPVIEEVVDLGLSVKWRAWNIGATKPIEYGDYFAWAETETYYTSLSYDITWGLDADGWKAGKNQGYRWQSYKYRTSGFYAWEDGTNHLIVSKYNTQEGNGPVDNKTVLDPEDDAAHVILGGDWRMPTKEEWQELLDNCTTEYIKAYDFVYKEGSNPGFAASAMKFTSKINGKSIIFPLSGHFFTDYISIFNSYYGYYWSSSLVESYIEEDKEWAPGLAWALRIVKDEVNLLHDTRSNGLPIRPVMD